MQEHPAENDSFTPEDEKQNQQDSIEQKEGPIGRHVVCSLYEITHGDQIDFDEDGVYADASWGHG